MVLLDGRGAFKKFGGAQIDPLVIRIPLKMVPNFWKSQILCLETKSRDPQRQALRNSFLEVAILGPGG